MDELLFQRSYTLAAIKEILPSFWACAKHARVFAFHGEMGAGKTTFIRELCDYLGVEDAVSSPTFALINEYHFHQEGRDRTIYHMDWYRLRDTEESVNAGMEDALNDPDAYCFVEWAEKASALLPRPHLRVEIKVKDILERKMSVYLIS